MRRMKMIALFFAVFALATPVAGIAGNTQLVPQSRLDGAAQMYTRDGMVGVVIREVHAETVTDGKQHYFSVFVLYEPTTGAFSWDVIGSGKDEKPSPWSISRFCEKEVFYIKDLDIYSFFDIDFFFYVRAYHGRASSIDDAEEKALTAVGQYFDSGALLGNHPDLHEILLTRELVLDLFS